jgi:hypothetical protein
LPAEPSSWRLHRADLFADRPKDDVATADERTTLVRFLDYLRAVLARKAEGLTDEQADAPCPHPPDDATLADAMATYWAEIDAADRIYAGLSLAEIERSKHANYSLRWILVHLIEEYARHCGHADLIRPALDGATRD